MKRIEIITALLLLWSISFAQTYTVESVPNPQTTDATAYVSNPDAILSNTAVASLNATLNTLEAETGVEIAVVALHSIGDADILQFETALFNRWKIGKDKKDNGLLILFVLDRKKISFEVGYGLEGVLPDGLCKRIQMQQMIPHFKKGDYDTGIIQGTRTAINYIKEDEMATTLPTTSTTTNWKEKIPYAIAIWVIASLFIFLFNHREFKKIANNAKLTTNVAKYGAIKTTNNGTAILSIVFIPIILLIAILMLDLGTYATIVFPLSLGGIPNYIYGLIKAKRTRKKPIKCSVCDGKMHRLSERKEDKYLTLEQQFEEKLDTVDYDVFLCDDCGNETIYTIDKPSKYTHCPRCNAKTYAQSSKRTIVAPSYMSSGTAQVTYKCRYCGFESHKNKKLPRLKRNRSGVYGGMAGGSVFSSGSEGFSGGGSFGGGMSGGGGATSGW